MIKSPILQLAGRWAVPCSVVTLGLLSASCRLPSRATWSMVQQRGLIPVMMTANPDPAPPDVVNAPAQEMAKAPTVSDQDSPLSVQAVQQPEIAKIPFANPVPGRPGYVFSPHTPGRKMVDVRNYSTGAEVRCPYTMQAFNVPDFTTLTAATPPPTKPRPQKSVAEVVSSSQTSGADSLPILPRKNQPSPVSQPADADIPYGSRVPGRIGFVYSPFADKNQLVDVAGIAPGVEVKCPYSNKLFRVPEPLAEEIAPAPVNIVPESAPPVDAAPVSAPSPAPAPAPQPQSAAPAPAPTPSPAPAPAAKSPTAEWSDKEKSLVQSPFGSAGQLVDVSGRAPGSTMQCPFTNKEFIIPAP